MTQLAPKIEKWCLALLGANPDLPQRSLAEYLAKIPRLEDLKDVPSGTPVLVRGDVDCKPGAKVGEGDVRLRSMVDTLQFGRQQGWKQIIFGHIGRKPEGSLKAVAARLSELLDTQVELVTDWFDDATLTIPDAVTKKIAALPAGGVLLLENTRKYDIERVLWKAKAADVPKLAEKLARFVDEVASKIAKVYVNEALSAGSLDTSTTIVPAGMERVALGQYVAREFDGPMRRCLDTELVVFSGLKIDKLDDLEAMIARGKIRHVIAAGSLAMALKKASAELDGGDFNLGVAEDAAHSDKPYFIPSERIAQAREMISQGRSEGIDFILPVDFVLADGTVSETIGPGQQQFDVGPQTSAYFAGQVGKFIEASQQRRQAGEPAAVAFHNGVFGMFEDPRFENGTREFVQQLKRMKDAGVEVYVGGGEGGVALDRYGQPDWVTHCFTAGGTVLNALGATPVPYLLALSLAGEK